jgi:hypothetical protein
MSSPVPNVGDLVPLGQCVIKVDVAAQATMPDTPNGYTATPRVMADQGDLDITALAGPRGPDGEIGFAIREEVDPYITAPSQLQPLSNSPADIGRYFLLREYDDQGTIIGQFAYIWYGTSYRKLMMGAQGPPGPVPAIQPGVQLIDPGPDPDNPPPSYINTGGPRLEPTWLFNLAVPKGPVGLPTPVQQFPDVKYSNTSNPPVAGQSIMGFSGQYTADGYPLWGPVSMDQLEPQTWSMPESAFSSFFGFIPPTGNGVPVGSFSVPPQPFPWTPIVWGHLGQAGSGIFLTGDPFMLGCQVLLGDPNTGYQVARGLGNVLGKVNIMPHYSTSTQTGGAPQGGAQVISPENGYCVVPANHGDPAMGTVYVNLWNDGAFGVYNFVPTSAQLFLLVLPMGPVYVPEQQSAYPQFGGAGRWHVLARRNPAGLAPFYSYGDFVAKVFRIGEWPPFAGTGTLTVTVTHH